MRGLHRGRPLPVAGSLPVGTHRDRRPGLTGADVLLAVSALAMGIQTAAVFSLGVAGVFTTAATATTTVLMGDTAHWAQTRPDRRRLVLILAALVSGAVAGGLLVMDARAIAPVVPLTTTGAVLAVAVMAPYGGGPERVWRRLGIRRIIMRPSP